MKSDKDEVEMNKIPAINAFLENFVLIEAGEFIMGDAEIKYAIQHKVSLNSFYLQVTTVTQEFWELIMGNNPSHDKINRENPVTDISWYDCQEFIKKLNAYTGKKYRLPTEAEWEYAARGANLSKGYIYAGSDNIDEVAWYIGNSDFKIHPVCKKKPNELGLYDMSGNVYEWCLDWFDKYKIKIKNNPSGPAEGETKVLRGGCWYYNAMLSQIARRSYLSPDDKGFDIGLRLLLPVE